MKTFIEDHLLNVNFNKARLSSKNLIFI